MLDGQRARGRVKVSQGLDALHGQLKVLEELFVGPCVGRKRLGKPGNDAVDQRALLLGKGLVKPSEKK